MMIPPGSLFHCLNLPYNTCMETKLDCLGDICPLPIFKLQNSDHLQNSGDSIKLITDHSCTVESVRSYCKLNHLTILDVFEPINGVWEITIQKP